MKEQYKLVLKNIKEKDRVKKYSVKTKKISSSQESLATLSNDQKKKKEFIDRLKSECGKIKEFKKSDHSKYLP